MRKKVFKLSGDKITTLATDVLLAAIETRGHAGHFIYVETLTAMKDELRRRVDEALIAAGATVIEATPIEGEPDWGYPASVK